MSLNLYLLKHKCCRLQAYCAKVGCVFHLLAIRIVYLACALIAYHTELEHYPAFPTTIEIKATSAVGLSRILHRPTRLWVYLTVNISPDKRFARLGINNLSLEGVGMAY